MLNTRKDVQPSRTTWLSRVHCEGPCPIGGGESSGVATFCDDGPLGLKWTLLMCWVSPEQFLMTQEQKGQDIGSAWGDMGKWSRKVTCVCNLVGENQQRSTQCSRVELCHPPHHFKTSHSFESLSFHLSYFFPFNHGQDSGEEQRYSPRSTCGPQTLKVKGRSCV